MMRPCRYVRVIALWGALASACGTPADRQPAGTTMPPAAPGVSQSLPAVALPDMSGLAESVQRQLREAQERLTAALAKNGTSNAERADAYAALGRLLMAARFGGDAATCYAHAQQLAPDDGRWPYYLGHAYLRAGDRGGAIAAFDRAVALKPSDLPARVWLAETYLDDGQLSSAHESFRAALTVQPQSAPALFGAGRTALAQQSYAEAAQLMQRALDLDPRASAVHYPLAMAYRATGDRSNAEAHMRQRGNTYPDLPDPLMQDVDGALESAVAFEGVGLQALKAADFAAATEAFRKGLALTPDDASLRYWLGAALYASGHADEAEREFAAVVRQSPDFAKAHFSLGAIADAKGRRAEAISRYRAAVEADPGLPDARLRLAEDLRATGQLAAALTQYEAAVALDPGIAEAWIGGGQSLIALGRKGEAQDWLTRARRLHPGRPELEALQATLSGAR